MMVDFHPHVPDAERGNWEAALHDAGLLDARVTPDGRLISMDESSSPIQLASADMQPLEESRRLARVLKLSAHFQPARQDKTADNTSSAYEEALSHILTVIGVGHDVGQTWIVADGSWRNGPLQGQLTKKHAQYIGEEARARWRQARLRELATEIGRLKAEISQLDRRVEAIEIAKMQIETLVDEFPSRQPLVDATVAQHSARKEADEASAHLEAGRANEASSLLKNSLGSWRGMATLWRVHDGLAIRRMFDGLRSTKPGATRGAVRAA
jgi:hypothetical protein